MKRYSINYTPHTSEYDSPEVKAANQPVETTSELACDHADELEAHGIPRWSWHMGYYRFHGATWTFTPLGVPICQGCSRPAESGHSHFGRLYK